MASTSTATTTPNAGSAPARTDATLVLPTGTGTTLTTDVYGLFVGAFLLVLSLIVLVSTGSILSVLVMWATVALVLTVLVYYGFLSIDKLLGQELKTEVKEIAKEVPVAPPVGAPLVGSEVFHVSDQRFTYDEAPAVCAAYGAELATLEQIMDSFARGAEWCGYGWSVGGMALYPTQRETWDKLQAEVDPGKRTRCGRPGVNGGYFDPSLKFGVNCFGFKPVGRIVPPLPVPGTDSEKFRSMVSRFREMLKSFTLDPYSRQEWSKYDGVSALIPTVETFIGQLGGNPFKSEYATPEGVKEDFGAGDPRYVEPIDRSGLGQTARPLDAPFGLRGDRGPMGPKGDTGPQGPAGKASTVAGPQGRQGPPGRAGAAGRPGAPGRAGAAGPPGAAGRAGATGATGPRGMSGASFREDLDLIRELVTTGKINNYTSCVDNPSARRIGTAYKTMGDDQFMNQTMGGLCRPFYTAITYQRGETGDTRKPQFKLT